MNANEFFNKIEAAQQNKLASYVDEHNVNAELKPNQRIKEDKKTGILWLEERERFYANGWHTSWVRIKIVKK